MDKGYCCGRGTAKCITCKYKGCAGCEVVYNNYSYCSQCYEKICTKEYIQYLESILNENNIPYVKKM